TINKVTIVYMDVFLAPLSLIFSHNATALLPQIMNRLAQKYIHSGFTFIIKQPLKKSPLLQTAVARAIYSIRVF
ncbi:MAG: hypothetical protein J6L68_02610, partial [Muribaculaceae bacterium]|nr:hypothetical protein [Muribaculaceae bacterium]